MPANAVRTLALIGTQGHYGNVLQELPDLPHIRVTAVSSGGAESVTPLVDWCQKNQHDPKAYQDWRSILNDPPDAAVVCGPFEAHAAMSAELIEKGVHVLVEKPVALNLDDLKHLRETCQRNPNIHLAGMHFLRYDPGFYTAHRLIAEGAIGQVVLINARKSYKLGTRPDFYKHRETYGGTLLWVASHAVDWAVWYANSPVRKVQAFHTTNANHNHGDLESYAVCNLLFENQILASLSIDYLRPAASPTHGDDWVRIVGTQGVIEARRDTVNLIDAQGQRAVSATCDRKPFADFVDQIEGKRRTLVDTATSLEVTEICIRARDDADQQSR